LSVVMYEAGLTALFSTETGLWGRYLSRHAAGVDAKAHVRATGQGGGPNIRSQALYSHLRWTGLFHSVDGLYALIGTDATSPRQGYAYPYALETGFDPVTGQPVPYGPFPFLMPALKEEFPDFRPL
jgi:hypothetical protein